MEEALADQVYRVSARMLPGQAGAAWMSLMRDVQTVGRVTPVLSRAGRLGPVLGILGRLGRAAVAMRRFRTGGLGGDRPGRGELGAPDNGGGQRVVAAPAVSSIKWMAAPAGLRAGPRAIAASGQPSFGLDFVRQAEGVVQKAIVAGPSSLEPRALTAVRTRSNAAVGGWLSSTAPMLPGGVAAGERVDPVAAVADLVMVGSVAAGRSESSAGSARLLPSGLERAAVSLKLPRLDGMGQAKGVRRLAGSLDAGSKAVQGGLAVGMGGAGSVRVASGVGAVSAGRSLVQAFQDAPAARAPDKGRAGEGESGSSAGTGGTVMLDGRLVGHWLADRMGRDAARAPAGMTGFDARQGASWGPSGAV